MIWIFFDTDLKIKVFAPTDVPLTLECANKSAGEKLLWYKERVLIHTALAGNEDLIKLNNETGVLELLKTSDVLYGNYTCKGTNSSTEYRIVRKYLFKIILKMIKFLEWNYFLLFILFLFFISTILILTN